MGDYMTKKTYLFLTAILVLGYTGKASPVSAFTESLNTQLNVAEEDCKAVITNYESYTIYVRDNAGVKTQKLKEIADDQARVDKYQEEIDGYVQQIKDINDRIATLDPVKDRVLIGQLRAQIRNLENLKQRAINQRDVVKGRIAQNQRWINSYDAKVKYLADNKTRYEECKAAEKEKQDKNQQ